MIRLHITDEAKASVTKFTGLLERLSGVKTLPGSLNPKTHQGALARLERIRQTMIVLIRCQEQVKMIENYCNRMELTVVPSELQIVSALISQTIIDIVEEMSADLLAI